MNTPVTVPRAIRDILAMILGVPLVLAFALAACIDADNLATKDHPRHYQWYLPPVMGGGRLVLVHPSYHSYPRTTEASRARPE